MKRAWFIVFFMITFFCNQLRAATASFGVAKDSFKSSYSFTAVSFSAFQLKCGATHRKVYPQSISIKPIVGSALKTVGSIERLHEKYSTVLQKTTDNVLYQRYLYRLEALSLEDEHERLVACQIVLADELYAVDAQRKNYLKNNSNVWRVQELYDLVGRTLTKAAQATEVEQAFSFSDMAYTFCQSFSKLCNVAYRASSAVVKGSYRALKTVTTVEHWKEFATNFAQVAFIAFNAEVELNQLDAALVCSDQEHRRKVFERFTEQGIKTIEQFSTALEQTKKQLAEMSWEQLMEKGTEVGATLLFDTMLLQGASWGASVAGKNFLNQMNGYLAAAPEIAEAYCTQAAGIAKAVLEAEICEAEVAELINVAVKEGAEESLIGKQLVQQIKKGKKPYVMQYLKPEKGAKIPFEKYVENGPYEHIFSGDHKKKGILNLGKS